MKSPYSQVPGSRFDVGLGRPSLRGRIMSWRISFHEVVAVVIAAGFWLYLAYQLITMPTDGPDVQFVGAGNLMFALVMIPFGTVLLLWVIRWVIKNS